MNDQMPPVTGEPKKNNTVLIIAIVVVVLCCCCIAAIGLWQLGDCITNPNDPSVCPLASTLINSL